MITEQLTEAKFLFKRLPKHIEDSQQIKVAMAIAKQLWIKKYEHAFQLLSKNQNFPLAAALMQSLREKVIGLIQKTYVSIGLQQTGQLLGLEQKEVIELAKSKGWQVQQNWVYPKPAG